MDHPLPSTFFPKAAFAGWKEPLRFEADVRSLEIEGKVPKDLNGAFYRVQPDQTYPPRFEDDLHINGDGNVASFVFEDGHVDFKNRYVRTAKFVAENEARQALVGRYRNKYTDDPRVKNIITRSTANTHIVYHAGKMMALKEDGPPWEVDATTLETRGIVDYHGTRRSPTHTAHPKFDFTTGEMVAFGYEAKGDATPDICYFTVDKNGTVCEECWIVAPYASMIHDFFATENYVIFPLNTLKSNLEQMQKGGDHFFFDDKQDFQYIGVLPRRGAKPEDVKWFKTPHGFWVHTINSYEEDGKLVLDASYWTDCLFQMFPNTEGVKFSIPQAKLKAPVCRFRFDPLGDTDVIVQPEVILEGTYEFGRMDDRYGTRPYDSYWILASDPSRDVADEDAKYHRGFNLLVWHNFKTGEKQTYWPGPSNNFQEPIFVPRYEGAPKDDGYLLVLVNLWKEKRNDLLLFEARSIGQGPIATIKIPLRLREGLHGSWVEKADILKASASSHGTNGVTNGGANGTANGFH